MFPPWNFSLHWLFQSRSKSHKSQVYQEPPSSPTMEDYKKTRYISFQQQLAHSDNYCCKCGTSFRDPYSWFVGEPPSSSLSTPSPSSMLGKSCHKQRPLGRLVCRNAFCGHVACRDCNFISPWILRDVEDVMMEKTSNNIGERSLVGFICCAPGCGWSQTIAPLPREAPNSAGPKVRTRGCLNLAQHGILPKSSHTLAAKAKEEAHLAQIVHFSEHRCKAEPVTPGARCMHRCCSKCVKFELVEKDAARMQREQEERRGLTAALRAEQEAVLAESQKGAMASANLLQDKGSQRPRCSHLHGLAAVRMRCTVPDCSELTRWNPTTGFRSTNSDTISSSQPGSHVGLHGSRSGPGNVAPPPRAIVKNLTSGPSPEFHEPTPGSTPSSSSYHTAHETSPPLAPAMLKDKSPDYALLKKPARNFSKPLRPRSSSENLSTTFRSDQALQTLRPLLLMQHLKREREFSLERNQFWKRQPGPRLSMPLKPVAALDPKI